MGCVAFELRMFKSKELRISVSFERDVGHLQTVPFRKGRLKLKIIWLKLEMIRLQRLELDARRFNLMKSVSYFYIPKCSFSRNKTALVTSYLK